MQPTRRMRYAVIGTGWITDSFIQGAMLTDYWEISAVYSRNEQKGRAFGEKYGVSTVYTNLSDLAADTEIEAVYIASPNILHVSQSRILLEAGKHVLCEKPATVTPDQCAQLQELAARKHLIYLEAIMMLHLPQRKILRDALPLLGRISSAHFDFSQLSSKYPAYLNGELPNIFNPKMATGSLMDLGIYCVYPALDLFGVPEKITASASFLPTGADAACAAFLQYPDKLITLTCSKTGQDRVGCEILGDRGTLVIDSISQLAGMRFFPNDGSEQPLTGVYEKAVLMSGEARNFYRFITDATAQAEYAYASRLSREVSAAMAEIRERAGIHFPPDEEESQ